MGGFASSRLGDFKHLYVLYKGGHEEPFGAFVVVIEGASSSCWHVLQSYVLVFLYGVEMSRALCQAFR